MAYYFAADSHAGLSLDGVRTPGEALLVDWLETISADAGAIFLLGDIFDFWFEYKRVIPKGQARLLGKLAELTDRGIEIHFFVGNHDLWVGDYFEKECGLIVHREGLYTRLCDQDVYMAHGDGLGGVGFLEGAMRAIFHSKTARKLFSALIHPNVALRFGQKWSQHSRNKRKESPYVFRNEDEGMVRFAREFMQTHPVDTFVFGHLHAPTAYPLSEKTTLYVLGDWIATPHPVYGKLDESGFSLLPFQP